MPTPRIAVTRRLPPVVEHELSQRFEVRLNPDDAAYDRSALHDLLRDADGILCTVTDRFDAALLAKAGIRTRILANFGVGYENIDIQAARDHGIVVTNTPDVLTEDTADLAMALILAVARRLGEGERLVRRGAWQGWRPTQMLGSRVSGKTLGVIGWGRIGRALAARARGFAMSVLCTSRRPPDPATLAPLDAVAVELDELVARADVISLHTPATPDTRHLISAKRLAQVKPTAILINTSRGEVIDERALVEALAAGRLAGAGLDVYEREPIVSPELLSMENVVLLPHLGSATVETRVAMGRRAMANLEAFFAGEEPKDRVS